MERIFFVKNDDLKEVNYWLQKGGRVKMILPLTSNITTAYKYDGFPSKTDYQNSDIIAYVVVEFE